jgi:membrane protein implicated in regulation of membrane protease activity
VPLDLVLVLGVIVAIAAMGVWFTAQAGGLWWRILMLVAFAIVMWVFSRTWSRRRRDADDDSGRKVSHGSSWTSGCEEEDG